MAQELQPARQPYQARLPQAFTPETARISAQRSAEARRRRKQLAPVKEPGNVLGDTVPGLSLERKSVRVKGRLMDWVERSTEHLKVMRPESVRDVQTIAGIAVHVFGWAKSGGPSNILRADTVNVLMPQDPRGPATIDAQEVPATPAPVPAVAG